MVRRRSAASSFHCDVTLNPAAARVLNSDWSGSDKFSVSANAGLYRCVMVSIVTDHKHDGCYYETFSSV